MDVTVRIAGEAGQGVETAGTLLVEAFAQMGLHVFATQSYMSRIRGGLNWFDIRIADMELGVANTCSPISANASTSRVPTVSTP